MASRPETCPTCGRPLSEHDRHLRFRYPQPIVDLPESQRAGRLWQAGGWLLQHQDVGPFVRVLVPIRLTGGYRITFGAWLSVQPADLRRAWDLWEKPEYASLVLEGMLANRLPPWDQQTFTKWARAAVRDTEAIPYLVDSPDYELARVLGQEWPHEFVLAALAPYEGRQ